MPRTVPPTVRIVRILLFTFAGFSMAAAAGTLISWGTSSPVMVVATFVFVVLPGAAAFLLGVFIPRGGALLFWLIVLMCVFWCLAALSNVADGGLWFIQLLWPAAILVLHLSHSSREYFLAD